MPAIRLLDVDGKTIGTVILDTEEMEAEIVNTLPNLSLEYSASLTNVHSFTLVVEPRKDEIVAKWDPETKRMVVDG